MRFLDRSIFGASVEQWLIVLGVALGIQVVVWILRAVVWRTFRHALEDDEITASDLIAHVAAKTRFFFVVIVSLYFGSLSLDLSDTVRLWTRTLAVIAALLQSGIWAAVVLDFLFERYQKRNLEGQGERLTTLRAFRMLARIGLYSIVLLLILDNIPNVDVTSLIAGLGIGGIAIALALQNILGDLFASLSIAVDKPFVIGDFIIVGEFMGVVEKVGLKTTRVRSLSGEQLVFSNNDLLTSRIRNYKRMVERRIVFQVGVIYQTPAEKLEKIPGMIRQIIEAQDKTRFDRSHFKSFGAYSLDFESVYYVMAAEYNLYMDIQQAINLALFRAFAEEGIEFAYPTQLLYTQRLGNEPEEAVEGAQPES